MGNLYLAIITTVLYFIIQCIFNRRNDDDHESKPLKFLFRDCSIVFISVTIAGFFIDNAKTLIDEPSIPVAPLAFTDNPSF